MKRWEVIQNEAPKSLWTGRRLRRLWNGLFPMEMKNDSRARARSFVPGAKKHGEWLLGTGMGLYQELATCSWIQIRFVKKLIFASVFLFPFEQKWLLWFSCSFLITVCWMVVFLPDISLLIYRNATDFCILIFILQLYWIHLLVLTVLGGVFRVFYM